MTHTNTYISSEYFGGVTVASLVVYAAILLSGLTYGSASLMFKFANILIGKSTSFWKYQKIFIKAIQ